MSLLSRLFSRAAPAAAAPLLDLFDPEFLRRLEMLALSSRRAARGLTRGDRRTRKKGSGVEFADHRAYTAGDDIRFLDVAAYQRFGRLLLRVFEEEEDQSVYFVIDVSRSMGEGSGRKFAQALRLAAALGYVALTSLDRVTMVAVTDRVVSRMPPVRGRQRLLSLLSFLSNLEPGGATDLAAALHSFSALHKRRGLCILVSDLHDPHGFEAALNVLRFRRFDVGVLHLVDPRDAEIEHRGELRLVDAETGQGVELTLTDRLARSAKDELERRQNLVERFCLAKSVAYFRVDVDAPFDRVVLDLLARGGFLK